MGKFAMWVLIALVIWWVLRKGWLSLNVGGVELGGQMYQAPYVAPITHPYAVRPPQTPWIQFANFINRKRG